MDVTRWDLVEGGDSAHPNHVPLCAPVTARLVRGWQKRECASAASDGQDEWILTLGKALYGRVIGHSDS